MATYECPVCSMSVNATCGKCNEPLFNDTIKLEDGSSVLESALTDDEKNELSLAVQEYQRLGE